MKHIVVRLIAGLVLLAAIAGLAYFAYNAGLAQGAVASGSASAGAPNGQPYPNFGYGGPFWHPVPVLGFGCVGLLLPLFLLFLAFGAFRWMLWGPRLGHMHHGHWMGNGTSQGVPPMFAEWHSRAHGESDPEKKE
jgi:hypothetical protein